MNGYLKKLIALFLVLLLSFSLIGCSNQDSALDDDGLDLGSDIGQDLGEDLEEVNQIDEDGYYTSKDDVALYIHTYDKLPENFLTKNEARDLGWQSNEGNLWDVTDRMSIGGDKFGNREGLLPNKDGRQYYECDINYEGGYRGAERLVYSNDGLIYYTADHYDSFELLYGGE